ADIPEEIVAGVRVEVREAAARVGRRIHLADEVDRLDAVRVVAAEADRGRVVAGEHLVALERDERRALERLALELVRRQEVCILAAALVGPDRELRIVAEEGPVELVAVVRAE